MSFCNKLEDSKKVVLIRGLPPFHRHQLPTNKLISKILSRSVIRSTLFSCAEFGESGESDESGEPSDSGEFGDSGESAE